MKVYDRYYRKENYFGNPSNALQDFFKSMAKKEEFGSVVDLGAGQGRDSLFLADMGYEVTAVDLSTNGLNIINEKNKNIKTVKEDLYTYDVNGYDYVLLDGIMYFYQKNQTRDQEFMDRITNTLPQGGVLVLVMDKSLRTEKILKEYMEASPHTFKIIDETYDDYLEFETKIYFIALEKQ